MTVFDKHRRNAYGWKYGATIRVTNLVGGTPNNKNVAEAWLKVKLGADKDDMIREEAARLMIERPGLSKEDAAGEVNLARNLNGFKRMACSQCVGKGLDAQAICPNMMNHELFIEGRHVKAAVKEAASVALAVGKLPKRGWGATNKGLLGFLAEHIFIPEREITTGFSAPDRIQQRFISTFKGTGITLEEVIDECDLSFTVMTDHPFSENTWGQIWTTGEMQGIGASRSQGYGTYEIIRWDTLSVGKKLTGADGEELDEMIDPAEIKATVGKPEKKVVHLV